ncbi:MAG: hypothetical protein HW387_955 [Parachlamydiales bacterium]|nr:hypothetical protein [Parachlamydiales bacterium]
MIDCPNVATYQYPVERATEYHYYVEGKTNTFSPINVTLYQSPIPFWIKPISISKPSNSFSLDEPNNPNLLIDNQVDIASDTDYIHHAFKIWNAFDANDLSNLEISFDPALQALTIHECKVYRQGKWIDKLDMNEIRIIQREEELEDNIYDGQLSALLFLEDIREGDLLEYSYSTKATVIDKFSCYFPLQFQQRWEKYYGRIVKAPHQTLRTQINPTDFDCNYKESDEELSWLIEPCVPYKKESDLPPGYPIRATLEVTEYRDWNEVASTEALLYPLNPAFDRDPEVIQLVNTWKTSSSGPEERAVKALHFVQDEIRYLGMEEGISKIKPADPLVTLKKRFGDCKCKTQLLRAFLALLDLPSDPCLVHSERQDSLKNHLPSPMFFNHVIVRLECGGKTFYIDPTVMYQGGGLEQMDFPYGAGLVISDKTQDLDEISMPIVFPEIESHTIFDIRKGLDVEMKINLHFKGKEANFSRYMLKKRGLNKFSEYHLQGFTSQFDDYKVITPFKIDDNREANELMATATLRLKNPWKSSSQSNSFLYIPCFLSDYINQPIDMDRSCPLKLPDARTRETIEVHGGSLDTPSDTIEHKAFTFSTNASRSDRIECELMTHLNVLDPKDLPSFCEKLNEASQAMEIFVDKN